MQLVVLALGIGSTLAHAQAACAAFAALSACCLSSKTASDHASSPAQSSGRHPSLAATDTTQPAASSAGAPRQLHSSAAGAPAQAAQEAPPSASNPHAAHEAVHSAAVTAAGVHEAAPCIALPSGKCSDVVADLWCTTASGRALSGSDGDAAQGGNHARGLAGGLSPRDAAMSPKER